MYRFESRPQTSTSMPCNYTHYRSFLFRGTTPKQLLIERGSLYAGRSFAKSERATCVLATPLCTISKFSLVTIKCINYATQHQVHGKVRDQSSAFFN
jgi:hypothetical protein